MNKDARLLITGSSGFVGKNLVAELKNRGYIERVGSDKGGIWKVNN